MDEEYNFYDEDINKNNVVKFVVVLILLGFAVIGYYGYQKYKEQPKEKETDTKISVTDATVQSLYQKYNLFTTTINDSSLYLKNDLFGYYYRADAYTNKTISNEAKLVTALHVLFLEKDLAYEEDSTEPLKVEGAKVRETVTKLFGKDALYKDEGVDPENAYFCQFGDILYDEDDDVYYTKGEEECSGSNRPILKNKIVSAEKIEDELIITDTMAYLVPHRNEDDKVVYDVYNSMKTDKENLVDTITTQSEFAFYNYKQLHKFEYHFTKENDEYVLTRVERVK